MLDSESAGPHLPAAAWRAPKELTPPAEFCLQLYDFGIRLPEVGGRHLATPPTDLFRGCWISFRVLRSPSRLPSSRCAECREDELCCHKSVSASEVRANGCGCESLYARRKHVHVGYPTLMQTPPNWPLLSPVPLARQTGLLRPRGQRLHSPAVANRCG